MKKIEVEDILTQLKEIKTISDRQSFNVSSAINPRLVKVINSLEKEYDRMDQDKITLNCPAILLIKANDLVYENMTLSDYINSKIKELVMNGYKIIDFGISNIQNNEIYAYIKYTS